MSYIKIKYIDLVFYIIISILLSVIVNNLNTTTSGTINIKSPTVAFDAAVQQQFSNEILVRSWTTFTAQLRSMRMISDDWELTSP